MQKVRVAIVGFGRAAKAIHITALKKLSNVEIVGVDDPRQEPSKFADFATQDALLGTRPDVVVIATPPDSHMTVALAALEAGAHVFCEKPLADSVEEADAIVAAAEK